MTSVSFGEVAGLMVRNGADEATVRALRDGLVYPLTPVDDLAVRAALLKPLILSKGPGIGDRLCLALAARTTAVALTATPGWPRLPAQSASRFSSSDKLGGERTALSNITKSGLVHRQRCT